jgi:hypothetical protein
MNALHRLKPQLSTSTAVAPVAGGKPVLAARVVKPSPPGAPAEWAGIVTVRVVTLPRIDSRAPRGAGVRHRGVVSR